MKVSITISITEPLKGLFNFIEDVLMCYKTPNVKFTLEGLQFIISTKKEYKDVTKAQIRSAINYINSRKDRDYCSIYRVGKESYMYTNYSFKFKTTIIK